MKRKGNITAIPLILVITITLTIAVLSSQLILDEIQLATDNSTIKQEPLQDAENALAVFDVGIIFVNASFFIASFIFAYQIRSSPIFFIPSLIFLGIGVWLAGEVANIYSLVVGTGPFTSVANQFPSLTLFYKNLLEITAILGSVLAVLLYGKTRSRAEVAP